MAEDCVIVLPLLVQFVVSVVHRGDFRASASEEKFRVNRD